MSEENDLLVIRSVQGTQESPESIHTPSLEDVEDSETEETAYPENNIIMESYKQITQVSHTDIAKQLATATSSKGKKIELPVNDRMHETLASKNKVNTPENLLLDDDDDDDDDDGIWSVGMNCRATYDDDSIDYEAKILEIHPEGSCTVRFLGYNNLQECSLVNLVPSWGKETRRKQIKAAKASGCTDVNDDESSSSTNTPQNKPGVNEGHGMWGSGILPPQPPLPPMLANGGPCDDVDQNDALSAMLMAWYMSGYYTGLYQGQTQKKRTP